MKCEKCKQMFYSGEPEEYLNNVFSSIIHGKSTKDLQ